MAEKIKVTVNGACGKMGLETVKAVLNDNGLLLVGAVDVNNIGTVLGGVTVTDDLSATIKKTGTEVVVDFTSPAVVMDSLRAATGAKAHVVVGTTGIMSKDLEEIKVLCRKNGVNAIVAPNFAIGAVLMMKFASEAAKHFPKAEIIELHHDKKLDSPSGTSIRTAEMMKEASGKEEISIHSVRLPGFVASQEVILGAPGQTLTIKHDTISRESFMPGVILAIKNVKNLNGLVYGIDQLLF